MKRAEPRHLVVGLEGPVLTPEEAAWLVQYRPAGVILFSRNVIDLSQLCELCATLRRLVPELEITADHEGGAVSQLAAALGRPPAAWGLGILDDAGLTARVFEETGRRLAAAGIDRVLAPVGDVLTEPRNPVIGARAFGNDPGAVARHVVAAVTGLLQGGVTVCVKHWPGHGGSAHDTHRDSAEAGDDLHEGPFAAALEAGADGVMVGHLHLEARAGDGTALPATLDAGAIDAMKTRLASGRRQLPRVFADDVSMGGLGEAMKSLGVAVPEPDTGGMFDPGSLPPAWFDHLIDAGCDLLLVRGIPFAAYPLTGDVPQIPKGGTAGNQSVPKPDFDEGPYAEVRGRLAQMALRGFINPSGELTWLDFSSDDRWQAAAGATGLPEDVLAALRTWFGDVHRVHQSAAVPDDCASLVVSSHRPVEEGAIRDLKVPEEGVCLVLGHPSLADDLKGVLGRKWRVGALFDVFADDLRTGFPGPTKI